MNNSDLRNCDRAKLINHLGSDLLPLLEVARATLDSWPMRMRVEIATKLTEERLERLQASLEVAITNSAPGGADLTVPILPVRV
jgi:hypothetical protein